MEALKSMYLEARQLSDESIMDSIEALISEVRDLPGDAYTCTNMHKFPLVDASNNDLFVEFATIEKLKAIPVHSFLSSPEQYLPCYALALHTVGIAFDSNLVFFPTRPEADTCACIQLQRANPPD